jgi:hypothetical protein
MASNRRNNRRSKHQNRRRKPVVTAERVNVALNLVRVVMEICALWFCGK